MSDSTRRCIGIALILISLFICLIPLLFDQNVNPDFYRSGNRIYWGMEEIITPENGNIQVNTADAEELMEFPGIGETLSRMIIQERSENGPFYYAEDLVAVKGIGPATLERFRNMIDLTLGKGGE